MQSFFVNIIWIYLFIINLFLFGWMYNDKQRAIKDKWRVPESNLLFTGLIGGGVGGLLGQQIFRHKTQKIKFTICFCIGIVVDILLVVLAFYII